MKTITAYIKSTNYELNSNIVEESLALVAEGWTMQDVYETLFANEVYDENQLNEGWFGDKLRKLAGFADNAEDKAKETINKTKEGIKNAKDAVVAKFDEWSNEAKEAYNNLKSWAGDKWENIKDGVAEVIGKIEGAFNKIKDTLGNIIAAIGKLSKDIVLTTAGLLILLVKEIIALTKKGADLVTKLFDDAKMFAGNAIFSLGAITAKKAGFEKEELSSHLELIYALSK